MGITHSWNGSVLTITSDSGTSSADLRGLMGVRGPQGEPGFIDESKYYGKTAINKYISEAAPRNLLDNSYWADKDLIINQSGKTNFTENDAAGQTIDRWNKAAKLSVKLLDGYIQLSCASTATTYNGATQYFENPPKEGTTMTLAIKEYGKQVKCASVPYPTVGARVNAFTNEDGVIIRLQSDSEILGRFVIMLPVGATIKLEWVALYQGEYTIDNLPKYQYKGYLAEYNECLRYYWKSQYAACQGFAYSDSTIYVFWNIPTNMRTTPTFNMTDNFQILIRYNGNKYYANAADITQIDWYGYYIRFRINQENIGIPANNLIAANINAGTIELDATL